MAALRLPSVTVGTSSTQDFYFENQEIRVTNASSDHLSVRRNTHNDYQKRELKESIIEAERILESLLNDSIFKGIVDGKIRMPFGRDRRLKLENLGMKKLKKIVEEIRHPISEKALSVLRIKEKRLSFGTLFFHIKKINYSPKRHKLKRRKRIRKIEDDLKRLYDKCLENSSKLSTPLDIIKIQELERIINQGLML